MSMNRLDDYSAHMQHAASDACSFVIGLAKDYFLTDKRTRQAVIMSLIIIGEAATKVMENYFEFTQEIPEVPWLNMRGMRNRIAHGYFDINLDVIWDLSKRHSRNYSTNLILYNLIIQLKFNYVNTFEIAVTNNVKLTH